MIEEVNSMFLIYHYFDFMGKSGIVFDMIVPNKKTAEEWIANKGKSSILYKYEKVDYYFGDKRW